MNVKIPTDIPAGDYLLRAEAALHTASSLGGAQFYMTCCMSYVALVSLPV
jgi:lytic cellulose monooxygenase (C1-hydroxylating)